MIASPKNEQVEMGGPLQTCVDLARRGHAVAVRPLDEAVRLIELRRYQRILAAGRLPIVYALAVFLLAGMIVPFVLGAHGLIPGDHPITDYSGWGAGELLTLSHLAAALAAYLRIQQLWNQERRLKTLHAWLLTRQDPARTAMTTVIMAGVLGVGMATLPAAAGLFLGLVTGVPIASLFLSLLLLPLSAVMGASAGAAVFFISNNLAPKALTSLALGSFATLFVGLWLRIEIVQRGWLFGWEQHTARIARALLLATPVPAIFGVTSPRWWHDFSQPALGIAIPAWAAAFTYGAMLVLANSLLIRLGTQGYLRLAEDPDILEQKPQTPIDEFGQEFYWKGFRNPVLTRDIRTRLRSKETAEFIFFASIAVAAGAFIPLLLTTGDLSDPLKTASAARQVFFWLTMTLIALVTLVTPGLTADVITQERSSGTLEMLIGTSLRPRDILLGRLLGAVGVMLLLISPSLPLFGLCYLFHGASTGQVAGVYLIVILTMTVAGLIGLTQSSINARSGVAKFWAYATTALFVGIPGGAFWVAAAAAATDPAMRQELNGWVGVTAIVAVLWIFVLVLFWGNASEQLEYSEY